MKRTLTAAAALVASSAGAVGFAGTAAAAEPQLPANLPSEDNVAETTYHATGTLHSTQRVVGDVLPIKEAPGGKSESARSAAPNGVAGHVNDAALNVKSGEVVQDVTEPVGEMVPVEQVRSNPIPEPVNGAAEKLLAPKSLDEQAPPQDSSGYLPPLFEGHPLPISPEQQPSSPEQGQNGQQTGPVAQLVQSAGDLVANGPFKGTTSPR